MAHDNPLYFKVQAESLLSVPDGKPLSVIGKKYYPKMDRVTGPDLMRRIFNESKNRSFKHYFYGTTRENLDKLLEKIEADYPWITVVGSEASVFRPMTDAEETQLIDRINIFNARSFTDVQTATARELFDVASSDILDKFISNLVNKCRIHNVISFRGWHSES